MSKIIFLLPPSEGKNSDGENKSELISFAFKKPNTIVNRATQKDLKSKGKRFEEGKLLNSALIKNVSDNYTPAIERYSGVMYNAIGYNTLSSEGQNFFDDNFLILSGMYGLVHPRDSIGNYKLPIETQGLAKFWGQKITNQLQEMEADYIVNLLPISYQKVIDFEKIDTTIINVGFYSEKTGELKKMTHGVKKIKGEWIREICEKNLSDYRNFGGESVKNNNIIDISLIYT